MILTIYLTISILCIFMLILDSLFRKIGRFPDIDPFNAFSQINDLLQEVESEKFKTFISNIIENCLESPANAMMLIFMLCFTPILNVLFLIVLINEFNKKINMKG